FVQCSEFQPEVERSVNADLQLDVLAHQPLETGRFQFYRVLARSEERNRVAALSFETASALAFFGMFVALTLCDNRITRETSDGTEYTAIRICPAGSKRDLNAVDQERRLASRLNGRFFDVVELWELFLQIRIAAFRDGLLIGRLPIAAIEALH